MAVASSGWLAIGISLAGIAGIVFRPYRTREWQWAVAASFALLLARALDPSAAWRAVARGADVYAFLIGIMALAEIARHEGLFDWLAAVMLRAAGSSRARLFGLIYLLAAVVTVFLSNDTTAVVLTPAIATALERTDAEPLPYLYICAFVANAASFALPISNPANLVVFASHLPPLRTWLGAFALPALAAIAITYGVLRLRFFSELKSPLEQDDAPAELPHASILAAVAVGSAVALLFVVTALHADVGLAALGGAAAALAIVTMRDRGAAAFVARHISWHVVPLVAGLFVIVSALDRSGALGVLHRLFSSGNALGIGALLALADNVFNNLPVALATGTALASAHAPPHVAHASVVAVDLGPNISVTGSLASLLWMLALRRDGIRVSRLAFLRLGLVVTLPALAAALLLVR